MHPALRPLVPLLSAAFPVFAHQCVFTEVMYNPPAGKPEYIELLNLTSNRIDTAKWRLSGGVDFTFPAFNPAAAGAHFLREYERVVISSAPEAATRAAYPNLPPGVRILGPWTGSLDNDGESVSLVDAASTLQAGLSYSDRGHWPRSADGAGHSLQIINEDRNMDDWRNWRASRSAGGTPGAIEPANAEESIVSPEVMSGATVTVTDFNSTAGTGTPAVPAPANPGDTRWRYWNGTTAPQSDWTTVPDGLLPPLLVPDVPASPGWGPASPLTAGFAPLGAETAGAPFAGIRTAVPQRLNQATYYYRTSFNWSGPLTGNSFSIDQYIDDGAIFFLNGNEIGRIRMTAPSGHTSVADAAAPDATLEINGTSGSSAKIDGKLLNGTNVLAVEVHQNIVSSSDHVFAARLKISSINPGGVTINEIRPGAAGSGFVEFYNPTAAAVNLQNWYLSDSQANLTKYQISVPLTVPPLGFATAGFVESGLGLTSPVTVILTQPDGVTRQSHISSGMTVDGRSIGRKPAGSANWILFAGPTPGAENVSGGTSTVGLSEVHFGAGGNVDWVEFFNNGTAPVSGSSLYISSQPDLANKVALGGSISGGAFTSVNVAFPTDGGGNVTLYLSDDSNSILAAAEIERRSGLPSVQVWPAGGSEWYASTTPTRDAANNPLRSTGIVINEIMYDPTSGHTSGEFIELVNRSAAAVDLTGWRLTKGLDFTFASGTSIAAGEFIVVARDPAYITAAYGGGLRVLGPAQGTLGNGGDLVRLEDANGNFADSVDYKDGGNWPPLAAGQGSSLELLNPDMDNSQPSAWRASDESAKAVFQSYSYTGTYKELRGLPSAITACRELLVNLVSDGHVVLKNIKLSSAAAPGTNLITTGDATSHGTGNSTNGFLCTGTHCLSDTLADGFHLISYGSGDTKANKAEVDITGITGSVAAPGTYTLSFDARWVSGMPLLVAQTWDRSFGKVFRLPIPNNLGTPGAANSRAVATPPPTVDNLRHSPAVPLSTQPVVVSARVSSAAAMGSVTLWERIDNTSGNGSWTQIAMNDSGSGGDAAANDGIWSATIPARADGTIVQFYVSAASGAQSNDCPRTPRGIKGVNGSVLAEPERPAMYIVDNTPAGTAPGTTSQRIILSLFHRAALTPTTGFSAAWDWDHQRMSNFAWNATIIINERDVMYNGEIRRGGSPWTRSGNNTLERNRWKPPGDNVYRNQPRWGIDSDGTVTNTPARFHNRTTRYLLYLLGYPVPHAEFVQMIINADAPALRDAMELTDADFLERAYGKGGELYEIDDAWFMYDTNNHDDRLSADSVTGRWSLTDWSNGAAGANPSDESPVFFHGNWPVRFPEVNYDYASLSSLIKIAYNNNSSAISNEAGFREQMERMIDTERAAIYAAVRGYIGDWDNFTLNRGKNGYFFRRPDGKFEFEHWDSDLGWQNTGEAFIGGAGGVGWTNFSSRPWFRQRMYFYLSELLTKYTRNSARTQAYLDAINYQSANADALAPFKTSAFSYPGWFVNRETPTTNFITLTNYNRVFTVTTANNLTVATPLFSITGAASSRTAKVEITGHPEAVFAFAPTAANNGLWNLTNIALVSGLNTLAVRALDSDGTTVLSTFTLNVTLSVNAPPVASLVAIPPSRRVAANEPAVMDATASFDPEGTALTFAWTVTPSTGVTVEHSVPGKTEARFLIPGVYTVSVTVTDAAANNATVSTDITVFNAGDFASFGGSSVLGAQFTAQNVELRDNFSASAWYSLEDTTGRLEIQVLDDVAKPLASPAYTHPLITRDVPDSSDFILQTDLEPDTREFGNWQTGLWLEMIEGGAAVRYAVSLDGGLNVVVRRAAQPAAWTQLATVPVTGSGATLRVRRSGNSLLFDRQSGTGWVTVFTQSIPAGSAAGSGGVFVATSNPTTVRVSFDYLLVSDPSSTNSALANLRITEIMYNPSGAGGIEYIELTNTGTQPIELAGVFFEEGKPFSQFTFPSYMLMPGAFVVVTNVTAGEFSAAYPATPPGAIFQWFAGNIGNGGEQVTLRDPFGNIIQDFTFEDDPLAGWPQEPDGGGYSLEVVSTSGDYNSSSNWVSGAESGGSPGWLGAGPDSDHDGFSDRMEQLAGTSPGDGGNFFNAVGQSVVAGQKITWPSYPGRTYRIQSSPTLENAVWTLRGTVVHPTGDPAGTGSFTVVDPSPGNTGRQFYRVVVELTP